MEAILEYLQEHGESSITSIAEALNADRHVVSKQLRLLEERGVVTHRNHGPSTLWSTTDSALITRLQKDDELSNELKRVFKELPATISVHDEHNEVVWSTTEGVGHPRQCNLFHRGRQRQCDGCPVETVKEEGKTKTFTTTWNNDQQKTITLIPMTNKDNETTSIIEHIA